MGNLESNPCKNVSKRESRRDHSKQFAEAVTRFRAGRSGLGGVGYSEEYGDGEGEGGAKGGRDSHTRHIIVAVRKRPIFRHELAKREFDAITVDGGSGGCLTLHDARLKANLSDLYMVHRQFRFDTVFGELCSNDDVYDASAKQLVQASLRPGGEGTVLMYGQTGSGKTYTMTAIYERAARDIFEKLAENGYQFTEDSTGETGTATVKGVDTPSSYAPVHVSFCELSGDKCRDLFTSVPPLNSNATKAKKTRMARTGTSNGHRAKSRGGEKARSKGHRDSKAQQHIPVRLLSGRDGSTHAFPLVELPCHRADDLMRFISFALKCRETHATGVNSTSSRTHAICRIYIDHLDHLRQGGGGASTVTAQSEWESRVAQSSGRGDIGGAGKGGLDNEGICTLVDLAGSEHRIDSAEHNAARRREGSKINASLMALKSCVRTLAFVQSSASASSNASLIRYRNNSLTRMLKSALSPSSTRDPDNAAPRLAVIATVSPASKDTEHSLNTLRHACIMGGKQDPGHSESLAAAAAVRPRMTSSSVIPKGAEVVVPGTLFRSPGYQSGCKDYTEELGRFTTQYAQEMARRARKQNSGTASSTSSSSASSSSSSSSSSFGVGRGAFSDRSNSSEMAAVRRAEELKREKIEWRARRDLERAARASLPTRLAHILQRSREEVGRREGRVEVQRKRLQREGPGPDLGESDSQRRGGRRPRQTSSSDWRGESNTQFGQEGYEAHGAIPIDRSNEHVSRGYDRRGTADERGEQKKREGEGRRGVSRSKERKHRMRQGNHHRELRVGGKPRAQMGGSERSERTQRSKVVGPCLSVAERMMRRHMEANEDDSNDARPGDDDDDDDDDDDNVNHEGARERNEFEHQDSGFAIKMNLSHPSQRRGNCGSDVRRRGNRSMRGRSREPQQRVRTGSRGDRHHVHRSDFPGGAPGQRSKERSGARASAHGKKVVGASKASRKVQEYAEKKRQARERAKEIAAKRKADAERRKREMQARLRGGEEAY